MTATFAFLGIDGNEHPGAVRETLRPTKCLPLSHEDGSPLAIFQGSLRHPDGYRARLPRSDRVN